MRAVDRDACGIGFVADAHGRASHAIVRAALGGLAEVSHRGALAADAHSTDGSGLLCAIPPAVFGEGPGGTPHGVAMLFARGEDPRAGVEEAARAEGITVVDWRDPPTDDGELGGLARASRPRILQAVLEAPVADERAAYRLRRRIERGVAATYVVSCSFRTVTYKGLVAAPALGRFYPDLQDPAWASPFAVFHQRFSTNTLPTWERAQPYRTLCHNGEINTLAGNQARMRARSFLGTEEAGLGPEALFQPVLDEADSDSGQLDAAVELLCRGGRDVRHAVAMLVPEAWEGARELPAPVLGFYRYHACLMEPWDGPAGLIFTDGAGVGAALDRNGLRPLRFAICEDGLVACCSEAGAVDLSGHGRIRRGRLGPGQMLFVDPAEGTFLDAECKDYLATRGPYARWADDGLQAQTLGQPVQEPPPAADLVRHQVTQGVSVEELRMVTKPLAAEGKEPTFSMGDDVPLPSLAGRPRPLHHFLRQRFAQVTNPAIDHLRERLVMSLRTVIGPRRPLLDESPETAHLLEVPSFFLYPSAVDHLLDRYQCPFRSQALDATFAPDEGPGGLEASVARLSAEAEAAVADGVVVLVVTNRPSPTRVPVPALLATGAIHHRLVDAGLRTRVGLVVVADDARDTHHLACLLGYGADAICPRLALETVAADADASEEALSAEAQENFRTGIEDGVLKILSKMGISTVDSYRAAQIFEAVGLAPEVVDRCFRGTPAPLGGLSWEALGEDALARHAAARWEDPEAKVRPDNPGYYRDLKRGGEYHAHAKEVVDALRPAAGLPVDEGSAEDQGDGADGAPRTGRRPPRGRRAGGGGEADAGMVAAHLLQRAIRAGDDQTYAAFTALVQGRPPTEPRDLLELVPAAASRPLDEVEPATAILRRFSTGAMSHGSLSAEAHETLAEAMNLLGGQSNCGEGGEDRARFRTRGQPRGDRNSRIKQIASGRFGVTPEYCAFADELQIKIAQGSKPGEGGQLPGHKVSEEIARLRHTQPGVTLISPPPHHDIYSIEDLAQLIYDLKQVNGLAAVSVKLVAGDGVGTIAAGVVKALADVVQISGANGGTGASPLSSIKHAGMPWEVGLVDTQAALIESGLRDRVRIRVDGGLMTGRDVVVAALLGADEYSFGTAAMLAEGCIMLRACHRDTCTTGIATQRPNLRAKFAGTPEGVAAYLTFVAQEVRAILAGLGLASLDEAIGRVACLRQRSTGDRRVDALDLTRLLAGPPDPTAPRRFVAGTAIQRPRSPLGDRLFDDAFRPVWEGDEVRLTYRIANRDRTVGASLGGAIALEWGERGPRGTAMVRYEGSAGQSFGAFLTHGVELELVGEANDYVGKSMAGGRIVIRPPADDAGDPVLAGNTCLYGATDGAVYIAGSVGERFGVRNSGATAVVEGVGDHACEYMTGGTVVILGQVGYNLGAGMTGGRAFVWDPEAHLPPRLNTALVGLSRPQAGHLDELRWLVERHLELTGSPRAAHLLADWDGFVEVVWLVTPLDRVQRQGEANAGKVSASA